MRQPITAVTATATGAAAALSAFKVARPYFKETVEFIVKRMLVKLVKIEIHIAALMLASLQHFK